MEALVEAFVSAVTRNDEYEIGDFERSVNGHLLDLRRKMRRMPYSDVLKKIDEIQNYIQFSQGLNSPTASLLEVESLTANVKKDAQYIDELVQAHAQDWES